MFSTQLAPLQSTWRAVDRDPGGRLHLGKLTLILRLLVWPLPLNMGSFGYHYTQKTGLEMASPVSYMSILDTPWKINMEPTNHPFRKENDLPNLHDYVPC